MTTMTVAQGTDTQVYELVVYKIKPEYKDNFDEVLSEARKYILKFSGIIEHKTLRGLDNDLLFMDLVTWESLNEAKMAAKQLETMTELAPFMAVFEEIKFMDHFKLYSEQVYNAMNPLDDDYYYAADHTVYQIDVKDYQYLSLTGVSTPEDPLFLGGIEAISAVAQTLKKSASENFEIAPLEAMWWSDGELTFLETPREEWHWNLLIPIPDFVDDKDLDQVIQQVVNNASLKLASEIELIHLNEGKSLQVLHIGSYEEEGPTIEKIFKYASEKGLEVKGKHHEIYLSDPSKVATSELKTILRYSIYEIDS